MNLTIRTKLTAGFAGLVLLMASVAVTGAFAVARLKSGARDAVNIGGRLNSIALEIQVHNLEAQRKTRSYLEEAPKIGKDAARQTYLEEADFEVSEMQSLAEKAMGIAPLAEQKAKFSLIAGSIAEYDKARKQVIEDFDKGAAAASEKSTEAYVAAADRLHEHAEDGEITGRGASQSARESIESMSRIASITSIAISLVGLLLAIGASLVLLRAILVPIDHLKEVAEKVSMGDLDVSVGTHSRDEIGELADSFGRMLTAVKFFRMEAALAAQTEEVMS